jgi:S-adenosylmethionine:tRNA ribosyltransferase-isomerase
VSVTLDVGLDTFRPVAEDDLDSHRIHTESYRVDPAAAKSIRGALDAGRRVVAVGTTTVRALEAAAAATGVVSAGTGETGLVIVPGFRFQVVDALVTNFHLPRSSLLLLVSAFAGRERVLAAYAEAVRAGYRFYSYGDAMLIM